MTRRLFYKGRHRANKHSVTVLDIQATYPLSLIVELEHKRLHARKQSAA